MATSISTVDTVAHPVDEELSGSTQITTVEAVCSALVLLPILLVVMRVWVTALGVTAVLAVVLLAVLVLVEL